MTKAEILAMEPGSILEYYVALNVMGFSPSQMRDGWVKIGSLATYPRRYSTDISAAWEIVEKKKIQIIPQEGAPDSHKYLAIIDDSPIGGVYQSYAETGPLAICRVALLAVLEVNA